MISESPPRAWAEVNLAALRHNLAAARRQANQEIMAVIKADAYGHGLERAGRTLDQEGLPFLGVANTAEARRLDKAGLRTRPYILGATLPSEREEIVARHWTPCLCSLEEIDHFASLGGVRAHVALDTGMGRGGFLPDQLDTALTHLQDAGNITVTGIGSHLPVADEDPEFTRQQFAEFDELVSHLINRLPHTEADFHIHLGNSAGLLDYQSRTTNLARPGLMLFGISPLPAYQDLLIPVMTLKSRVSLIHELPAGHGVSYGRTLLERPTRAAVLGIGYGDGYPRALSGKGAEVLIQDTRCPLIGRVTMDQIIVDVTDLSSCHPGEEAILFGTKLLVSELAQKADSIPWELLTQITPRVERRESHSFPPSSR